MELKKLYVIIAPLAAVLVTGACQSAQRPATLLPGKAGAPTLTAANSGSPASTENQSQAQKPAEPAAKPVPAASADPVADLIAKVEKEYQAGQENYTAGHLEAARQNFDHAFDLLLSSNLEINSDPRLESEFDRSRGTGSLSRNPNLRLLTRRTRLQFRSTPT
jgi:membrane-bound lytic murein transglycosylase D